MQVKQIKRLAVVTTHPIQYHAPLYELLTKRGNIHVKVFYTWGDSVLNNKFDPGFGKVISWDIPLLYGYEYEFLENTSKDKGSHHFNGIINPGLIQMVSRYEPDAIMVYGWAFNSHLKLIRHFKGKVPVLFRGDSTLLDQSNFLSVLKRTIIIRWVYRFIDVALYVGKNNCAYFKKAGLKKHQLVFAPHAIDNDRFTCQEEDCSRAAAEYRRKLKIPLSDSVFLFAGKLEPKKSPDRLLQAFVESAFGSKVHLVIVGNGILEQTLKDVYTHHPTIHFIDFQNQLNMPAVYQFSDVFVLPSVGPGETWGLAVNEAMANGKPVIVSDKCGCAPDLVEDGINGYIFRTDEMYSLENALQKMMLQKNEWEKMGKESRRKISLFSFNHLASAIESTVLQKATIKN